MELDSLDRGNYTKPLQSGLAPWRSVPVAQPSGVRVGFASRRELEALSGRTNLKPLLIVDPKVSRNPLELRMLREIRRKFNPKSEEISLKSPVITFEAKEPAASGFHFRNVAENEERWLGLTCDDFTNVLRIYCNDVYGDEFNPRSILASLTRETRREESSIKTVADMMNYIDGQVLLPRTLEESEVTASDANANVEQILDSGDKGGLSDQQYSARSRFDPNDPNTWSDVIDADEEVS